MKKEDNIKILCQNKRVTHDYIILEKYEAGIELFGTEVKSLRVSNGTLNDSYCYFKDGEIFLIGFHIPQYSMGNLFNHDPDRDKKLLMRKKEIVKLSVKRSLEGLSIVPVKVYFNNQYVKVEIAVAQGKKLYDKRADLKKEDQKRYINKAKVIKNGY